MQVIRKRFDDKTIVFLLQFAWWDWSIKKITENIQAITTGNLEVLKKLVNSKKKIEYIKNIYSATKPGF